MSLAAAFASLYERVGAAIGAPYFDGTVVDQAEATLDDGGSIVDPGEPVERTCRVQIDAATWSMRQAEGYSDGDVRFIILAASLDGSLGTDAEIEVAAGDAVPADFVGTWMVSAIERDPAGIGYVGRGRKL